jgi:two-component system invasion response regulator UvrY
MSEILIIGDHPIVIIAMEMTLRENFPEFTITKGRTLQDAVETTSKVDLNLIILDVGISAGGSAAIINSLRQIQNEVPILIFSGRDDKRHAKPYIQAGVNGFVSKNASEHEIITAIEAVLSSRKYFNSDLWESFFTRLPTPRDSNPLEQLTQREIEIMDLLILGKWTKEIAGELKVSETTVSTHKQNIFRKLDVTNIIDLLKTRSYFTKSN